LFTAIRFTQPPNAPSSLTVRSLRITSIEVSCKISSAVAAFCSIRQASV